MSLVLIDGFDLYPAISGDAGMNVVWTFNSTSSMGLDPGRFGGQAIRSSQDRFITSPTFTLTASVSVGFAFKVAGFPSGSEKICRLMSASGDQVIVGVNSSRQLIACRGSISTVLGTSTETLSTAHLALPRDRGGDKRCQRDRHGVAGRSAGDRSERRGHSSRPRRGWIGSGSSSTG